ncbi:MAG: carboxypeptidase-like regulatory domain-containing protein [Saprospiraceae bacterium]|nr:carboxypeptidase-like regulatory domain-containing protein [Saprospiraceae bacterium]
MFRLLTILLIILGFSNLYSQNNAITTDTSNKVVQFSGLVLTESNGNPLPIPYADIFVKGKKRGTYSDLKGYYSFVAEKGDKVTFSAVGFKKREFTIPDSLKDDKYTFIQLLYRDTLRLPEVFIYPWPSREHFNIEFLAMNVNPKLQEIAQRNLAKEALVRAERGTSYDGKENSRLYFNDIAQKQYYQGQFQPMNILSPAAWNDFIKALKGGKLKIQKQKNKIDEENEDEK